MVFMVHGEVGVKYGVLCMIGACFSTQCINYISLCLIRTNNLAVNGLVVIPEVIE